MSIPKPDEAENGSSTQQRPKQLEQSELNPGVATRGSCHGVLEDPCGPQYHRFVMAKALTKHKIVNITATYRLSRRSLLIAPTVPGCSRNETVAKQNFRSRLCLVGSSVVERRAPASVWRRDLSRLAA
ncbi:hypothetical protein GCM10023339_04540 [Alloalcanivorax gelatiniphagus]